MFTWRIALILFRSLSAALLKRTARDQPSEHWGTADCLTATAGLRSMRAYAPMHAMCTPDCATRGLHTGQHDLRGGDWCVLHVPFDLRLAQFNFKNARKFGRVPRKDPQTAAQYTGPQQRCMHAGFGPLSASPPPIAL